MSRAELNFGAGKITVTGEFDPGAVIREARKENIRAKPEGALPCVSAEGDGAEASFWAGNLTALLTALSGLFALLGWLADPGGARGLAVWGMSGLPGLAGGNLIAARTLYLLTILIGGYPTLRKGVSSLRVRRFDIHALMTIAVSGAIAIGEWSEGAVVSFLFGVSEALESYSMDRARRSIRALMDISPREATVRRGGQELRLPVDQIEVGDLLMVRPGEKIAMDGRVRTGHSAVNQAAITGESIPVEKGPGAEVFAGTLNGQASLEVEVTKLVADTTLAKIIHLVEEAQAQRAPSQAFVDRFAAVYTPVVVALAAVIAAAPPLFFGHPWGPWAYRALALLVVSCPCALVVSTPVALVSAIGNAARHGVLIKGGVHLENAGSLRAIAFDKTGTLTAGRPEVTDVVPLGGRTVDQVLSLAASLEARSEHPLAQAIVRRASSLNVPIRPAEGFESITGKGARARVGDEVIYVGSPRFFAELGALGGSRAATGVAPAANAAEAIGRLQEHGKTVIAVGTQSEVYGLIAVADTVRQTSRLAVTELKRAGIERTVMLTGDNAATARAIAAQVGVDEVKAELLPQDKVAAVKELGARYGRIAMVGDGVNDAPALATATVGIAMAGAGTDAALETADIALMADDLSKLPFAMRLSRAALGVIRQNITFSLVIKALAFLAVFPGWLTLWLAILADMGATIIVTLNGIRLVALRPRGSRGERV